MKLFLDQLAITTPRLNSSFTILPPSYQDLDYLLLIASNPILQKSLLELQYSFQQCTAQLSSPPSSLSPSSASPPHSASDGTITVTTPPTTPSAAPQPLSPAPPTANNSPSSMTSPTSSTSSTTSPKATTPTLPRTSSTTHLRSPATAPLSPLLLKRPC